METQVCIQSQWDHQRCICEICHIKWWEQTDEEPPGEHSAVLHADWRANMREIKLPASQLSFVINALQIQDTGSETEVELRSFSEPQIHTGFKSYLWNNIYSSSHYWACYSRKYDSFLHHWPTGKWTANVLLKSTSMTHTTEPECYSMTAVYKFTRSIVWRLLYFYTLKVS